MKKKAFSVTTLMVVITVLVVVFSYGVVVR